MLSSAKIGTSSWRYYTDGVACRTTEYYLGVGEAPGRWHGRGLEQLGLEPGELVTEQQLERVLPRIPMGRVGEPDEVAAAITWLLGPDAGYVTGATLRVAGGL